jgi:IS1 family transposase
MSQLTTTQRAQILSALVEGTSIRGVSRITGASTTTILKLLADVGQACSEYQDEKIRHVLCDFVEMDEIHSFIGKKGEDVWCWIALCATTKLRLTWHVGDRSSRSAMLFCHDVSKRIQPGAQITTDGLSAYRFAVTSNMPDVHFAQLVKIYTADNERVIGISKMPIQGDPMPERISTSYVEASNLHMRMQNRRYARRTNAHSKIMENHCHMIALGFMAYNFARKHGTLKCTPAQKAGLADKQWTMADIIRMMDERQEAARNAKFEAAFSRLTPQRTHPKSYAPTPKAERCRCRFDMESIRKGVLTRGLTPYAPSNRVAP